MLRLLLAVVAFIVYGSLYPFEFHGGRPGADALQILLHTWPARIDRFLWRDACVNVALYFPLGVSAALVLMRHLPRAAATAGGALLGLALSVSIELLQVFDTSRTPSLLDVASNFAGAVGGACAALLFHQEILAIMRRRKGVGGGGALLLACCWMGYQLYPFMPMLSRYKLRANLTGLLTAPVSPAGVYASAAEWFAFALVLRAISGRLKTPWLLLALCCLPVRMLVNERTLSSAELLGAAIAFLLWTYPAEGSRAGVGAVLLAAAIVVRELSPFAFSAAANPMQWVPFGATLNGERLNAALVILRKSFEYGTVVWLLRASGWSYRKAGSVVAGALLLLEVAQRYLPGRQPELTDPIMALILTGVLWVSENPLRRGKRFE